MNDPLPTKPAASPSAPTGDQTSAAVNEVGVATSDLLNNPDFRNFLLYERTIRSGPLPDPTTLQALVAIYPDAAKMIFSDFAKQSSHRREMERLALASSITLAMRGQVVGGLLGGIGLVGSITIAGLGHESAASVIGTASLISLVSVFVLGRDQQRKERTQKAAIREKIKQGELIEEMESKISDSASTASSQPTSRSKKSKSS